MDKTSFFGLFEIIIAIFYFFIAGLSVAKRSHITAFRGLIYCAIAMGLYDLFQGLYYTHQTLSFSPIMLSIVYAVVPFTYLTCFIVSYQYAFPNRKGSFLKYLFIIPIITAILSFTYRYHDFYINYGYGFSTVIFREIVIYKGFWLRVVQLYDFLICVITMVCLLYIVIKMYKIKRRTKLVLMLLFLTLIIDFTVVITDSLFLYYFDLVMRLACIFFMYLTLDKDETENIIFQGQIKIIESLPFPIIFQDRDSRIIYANEEAINACSEISDFKITTHYSSEFFSLFSLYKKNIDKKDNNNIKENILIKKDSGDLLFLRTRDIQDKKNSVIGKMYMFITLDSMQLLVKDLRSMALKDKLCGFYNRNYLEICKDEYEQNSDNLPFTLIMCDINNLKVINDKLGHSSGDEYILHCCSLLRSSIRKSDVVLRLGGDEFLIILPNTPKKVGEEIAKKISSYSYENKNPLLKDVSLTSYCIASGSATADFYPFTFKELTAIADTNMYETKAMQKG